MSVGDPNGIGPEIALKTLLAYEGREDVRLTLFGPAAVMELTAEQLGLTALLHTSAVVATDALSDSTFAPGRVCAEAGAAMIAAATAAILATRRGEFDAVVAGPHHETSVHLAGIPFSGYPSLVARVCGQSEDSVFLLLVGGGLNIVHATLHESVHHALARLTPMLVEQATLAGVRAMQRLGVAAPRVGLFGINPHAGENGLFGDEDERITRPAAERLRVNGLQVDGPLGADSLLAERRHDLYVAMLHDQGHIPVKLLSPKRASALSIGADVILSSVGHGSAMDIAGRSIANASAMIDAVARLAAVPTPTEISNDALHQDRRQ
ncbi:MAG: 4-hydroxythreonine-4-phosphate dehydrogenase PdxA [Gammaproteobacteria bacterium]|nr:4-hydroxythreonine-4-phosphate dehydrogenase PdxA [Gammaproteobacteria bacterium]MBU0788187.1 4-hydroxythreonine-4-phosphate dehydrogenase PdxA [Gammaproteobacteria bacterium]MBU0815316.1 4-hydroxythreonine-4-phosphate dehydrogenase PdxA [Gammaproteobacteria bacterium]MBU1785576.1 4-hydroxythreonine-4-phosphate dehydrogenase PdxA [Gammaproteobacteria bacterium]